MDQESYVNEMNARLWSGLPSGLLGYSLSFLPVPVVCRFRTVCKDWNSLICTPKFGALCIEHAKNRDASYLISSSNDPTHSRQYAWSFLDLNADKPLQWYSIKRDVPQIFHSFHHAGRKVAADGGLVCEYHVTQDGEASIFVSNPLVGTIKQLPYTYPFRTPYLRGDGPQLHMVVDTIAHTFKVFVMPDPEESLMLVYESTTNTWRNSSTIPPGSYSLPGQELLANMDVLGSIVFGGLIYILMGPNYGVDTWLWSYNHVEDMWSRTGVVIGVERLHYPQLVVSDNRLFLGSWMCKCTSFPDFQHNDLTSFDSLSYEVCEVDLENQTLKKPVFQMSGAVVAHLFKMPTDEEGILKFPFELIAFGFGKSSIVFLCETLLSEVKSSGVSITYNLSTNSWQMLPTNPWFANEENGKSQYAWLTYGNPMNLISPASALWEHESP